MSKEDRIAKDGEIWVCGACGKYGKDRYEIGDEACFVNAVLCKEDSLEFKNNRVISAIPVESKKHRGEE